MMTTSKHAVRRMLFAGALLSLGMGIAQAGPSGLQSSSKQVSRTVAADDLDLATREGMEALRGRVAAAAKEICWRGLGPRLPGSAEARHARRCFDEAVGGAMAAVGRPAG